MEMFEVMAELEAVCGRLAALRISEEALTCDCSRSQTLLSIYGASRVRLLRVRGAVWLDVDHSKPAPDMGE